MRKKIAILIFDDAEVLDFAGPFEVFSVTSQVNNFELFDVFTIARTTDAIKAVNGLSVNPDFSFSQHPSIDILIISGGQGTKKLLEDSETLNWIKNIHQKSQLTLSICSGSRLLARLGLLDNRPYCTHHQVYDHIQQLSPSAMPQKEKRFTLSDERLYTSGGISAGIDLSFHIVETLLGKTIAKKTAEYMEYSIHL